MFGLLQLVVVEAFDVEELAHLAFLLDEGDEGVLEVLQVLEPPLVEDHLPDLPDELLVLGVVDGALGGVDPADVQFEEALDPLLDRGRLLHERDLKHLHEHQHDLVLAHLALGLRGRDERARGPLGGVAVELTLLEEPDRDRDDHDGLEDVAHDGEPVDGHVLAAEHAGDAAE